MDFDRNNSLVFLDYIDLLSTKRQERKHLENDMSIATVAAVMKTLVKQYDLVLSINKDGEYRVKKDIKKFKFLRGY